MTGLVACLLIFLAVSVFFVFFHLMLGKQIRPAKPDAEKLTIYECGEPTIGTSWIQFDLRFYVVALLFVIFDVEVAFFFPWAVVFGKANMLAGTRLTPDQRVALVKDLVPAGTEQRDQLLAGLAKQPAELQARLDTLKKQAAANVGENMPLLNEIHALEEEMGMAQRTSEAASKLALLSFFDIMVFFFVLLVGYAYLWKRGDLDWVRSVAAEKMEEAASGVPPPEAESPALVGVGRAG